MISEEFLKIIKRLSTQAIEAMDTIEPTRRNENWTRLHFIQPLLSSLGWFKMDDVDCEAGSDGDEGRLDYVLRCPTPMIGIETKALDVKPPEGSNHPQIKKGLKQTKERGASYFIWTNGDCWQFYSLALPNAPMYEIKLSNAHGNSDQLQNIASDLYLIDKKSLTSNPNIFNDAILKKWKKVALPAAIEVLVKDLQDDFLQIVRKALPNEINIEDDEILYFFKSLKLSDISNETSKKRTKQIQRDHSFPEDWQKLLDSFEPEYDQARKRFCKDYYLKLAKYLVGDKYKPWSRKSTWRYVGAPEDMNERKKLGPVIALFREWNFIEDANTPEMYQRVEESVPFLMNLLEK